ncbi:hypothetical protein DIZ81_08360 [Legionella taurinensis]|uniref:Uncharacterized protein n=1 Tax=Legionella taurinensis TaxID=70611 RepID=A0A3A5L785_9GAMM|nr:hypothetical protein [Legionella taurinensis]MDX1837728.1 hypothetical protein [Legionella taurinensis]PUT40009.1 hypothetical protein DB744_08360 [Legionella taurinensis]PUT43775.1 hypothetical protein DB746_05685 [Legionella taurinensis]PUT46092.1 hypothetical protein DB743_05065 [Legionella taurinensis]PUT47930.1 hypothetical protein DB745_06765 [Legionella taurinensis]
MSASKNAIRKELETLIATQYTLPPKQFAKEELAVKQTVEKLVLVMSQPTRQKSLLADIPIDSIENMTRRGHLSVVVQKLDDHFLVAIEEILKKDDITMEYGGETIALSELYKGCKKALTKQGKEPNFEDVLLRMYSVESPFYMKLNAIVSGYNNPRSTTDDEKKIAFLMNMAIHKAGVLKRQFEVHKTPDVLYRGQSFGLPNFITKFLRVKEFHARGELASLPPDKLVEVNIADIVCKKNVSMSSELNSAKVFATEKGIVLHVQNPEQLSDFYAIANVSAHPNEAEFLSRMPDDIAMIPVDIGVDPENKTTHIYVMCIHSQSTQLTHSTRLHDIKKALKDFLTRELNERYGFFASYLYSRAYTPQQKVVLGQLIEAIEDVERNPILDLKRQDEFLETTIKLLKKLYETNPTDYQKKGFDTINALLQDYSAAVADLSVVHQLTDVKAIIASEQKKLDKNREGKRLWLAGLTADADKKRLEPLNKDLEVLLRPDISAVDMRQAANNILHLLNADPTIGTHFKPLEEGIKSILTSLDKIEEQQQILIKNPSLLFKDCLRCLGVDPVPEGKQEQSEIDLLIGSTIQKFF